MLSDGKPTRTFCYVADAVVGYYKVLVNGRNGHAYNIGTETPEISMAELAQNLAAQARTLFGYTGKVIFKPSQEKEYLVDNPNRRCPRIDKAANELGYCPQTDINEGLRRSLLWYHGNRWQRRPSENIGHRDGICWLGFRSLSGGTRTHGTLCRCG